jgi:hypothetical protein
VTGIQGSGSSGGTLYLDNASTPYALTYATNNGQTILFNSANGVLTLNLPNPATNPTFSFSVTDYAGSCGTYNLTLHRYGSENIQNVAADYIYAASFGSFTVVENGTNWYLRSN